MMDRRELVSHLGRVGAADLAAAPGALPVMPLVAAATPAIPVRRNYRYGMVIMGNRPDDRPLFMTTFPVPIFH